MEDLPLDRIAASVPEFAVKDLPLGRTLMISLFYLWYIYIFSLSNIIYMYVCMHVYKVICPKAGLSLDMHYKGSVYLSLLDKRNE